MSSHLLNKLRSAFSYSKVKPNSKRSGGRDYRRTLTMETLESRQMLSITPLQNINSSGGTGEKPQSKIFEYAGQWWTAMPNSSGTSIFRLDGTTWTATQQISTNKGVHTDIKLVGDIAHVLLFDGTSTQLASLQYDSGPDNRFEPWSARPGLVNVPVSSSTETATIEVDSTGRMWVAYDVSSTVEVRYSDGPYTTWSAPITVASGINSDDISTIVAIPGGKIGVLWSNQSTDLFGFRVHVDGETPTQWLADERPASQSALKVGGGMADDHVHITAAADGTLYAAVKTSYDKSGYPTIALLVRRPNGVWDNLYTVASGGTRPTIALSDAAGKLIVAWQQGSHSSNIVYRESPLGDISLSPTQTLISGSLADATTTKFTSTDKLVFMANERSVLYSFDVTPTNLPPVVSAGPDGTAVAGVSRPLNGSATDDGKPTPSLLNVLWTVASAPATGIVTFGSNVLAATTATFSVAGNYVLQLAANDGQLTRTDTVSIVVSGPPNNDPPNDPPSPPSGTTLQQIAFQNGLFPNVTYAGSTDTKIAATRATTNYGNDNKLSMDGSPDEAGLFKWNVSAIPVGSVVTSAAIEFNVTDTSSDSYEVYALQRAWDELSATWQRYATGNNWAGAGASGTGDQQSAVLGQMTATSNGIYRINLNAAGVAAVQQWVNDPSRNFGIIIKDYAVSSGVDVSTSEASTAAQRPKLSINYNNPPVNVAPVVNVGSDRTAPVGAPLSISGVVTDDGLPNNALLTALWTSWGPGTAVFGDATQISTTAQFSDPGTYTLRLTVNDTLLPGFDELTVVVS
jgi:hypothetical protein